MWKNELTSLLKITYPIIQAPMAGGPTSSSLVSAVSNAGGLGMIGAGYMDPYQLRQQITEIRELTSKPFGVNLFVPRMYNLRPDALNKAKSILKSISEEIQAEAVKNLPSYDKDLATFHEQVQVLIEEHIPICSFTFGIPSSEVINKLKENGIIVVGSATSVHEAILNEKAGMDAVVVQGMEAGGHRGTFIGDPMQNLIGLMSLIPQAVDQLEIPVIAAGGIMDGRGLMAAKCLGASGVQMGTAFLVCEESGASGAHKDAIIEASEEETVLTKAFSGKFARGIQNRFTEEMKRYEDDLPEYPLQNELTKGIRKAAQACGRSAYMSLWSGQSPRLAKKQTVAQLMSSIIDNAEKVFRLHCN